MAQVDTNGKQGLFKHEQLVRLHNENTDIASNTAFDEGIIENTYMFVILWNLSVISHGIFPKCFFVISGAKSKNN